MALVVRETVATVAVGADEPGAVAATGCSLAAAGPCANAGAASAAKRPSVARGAKTLFHVKLLGCCGGRRLRKVWAAFRSEQNEDSKRVIPLMSLFYPLRPTNEGFVSGRFA